MTRWMLILALATAVACTDEATDPTDGDTDVDTAADTDDTDDGSSDADLQAGGEVFTAKCAQCHGADGTGVSGPNLNERVPNLTEAQIRAVIVNGQGYMPAIQVTQEEAANVVAFVIDRHG